MSSTLRNYQQSLARDCLKALDSHDRVVVVSPTGSGKTHIAVHGIVPFLPQPAIWLTHRVELAEQAQSYKGLFDVQMIGTANPKGYASVIIDEGHHACAKTYAKIIRQAKAAKIIALTATPYRLDGQGLGSVGFTHIAYGHDILELTNDGHLCPCEVFVPKSEATDSWHPKAIFRELRKRRFRSGIVYSRRVNDAYSLAEFLNQKGMKAKALSAMTLPEERNAIIHQFRAGAVKVLCNHTILTEGTDMPRVDMIVLNRATHSRALWRQMIGRGLRVCDGKEFCTVLDLAANSTLHGSIYDKEIFDLMGRVVATESRHLDLGGDDQESNYEYNNGEELKQWKPLPELKIMRRTLLNLNARLLKRRLLTDTSAA